MVQRDFCDWGRDPDRVSSGYSGRGIEPPLVTDLDTDWAKRERAKRMFSGPAVSHPERGEAVDTGARHETPRPRRRRLGALVRALVPWFMWPVLLASLAFAVGLPQLDDRGAWAFAALMSAWALGWRPSHWCLVRGGLSTPSR